MQYNAAADEGLASKIEIGLSSAMAAECSHSGGGAGVTCPATGNDGCCFQCVRDPYRSTGAGCDFSGSIYDHCEFDGLGSCNQGEDRLWENLFQCC